MHLKLVLLVAHLGFVLATPSLADAASSGMQARDGSQSSSSSYSSDKDNGGSYGAQKSDDSKHDSGYPHGQDSYNPGHLNQKTSQMTGAGPSDYPDGKESSSSDYHAQDHGADADNKKYDHNSDNSYDNHKQTEHNQQWHDNDHDQGADSYHKDDHDQDSSHKDNNDHSTYDHYDQSGYDQDKYSNQHGDKAKGWNQHSSQDQYAHQDQDWNKGYDSQHTGQDWDHHADSHDDHCPIRQHAVPFVRPHDDGSDNHDSSDVIGFFFKEKEYSTFNLFEIIKEDPKDRFYTIDLAEKEIYMKQFGFKDHGIVGYIFHDYGCGGVPLYRVFDRHQHKHYFTTSDEERGKKLGSGWEDQGITGYIYKP